ncbi:MAG: hypothetical protein BWY92_01046 [Firmicutes bacterium ADurb.BinA052]|nr:MAG: hypothetical protein BWY92_01046 [Firmicutes bacterium ADurb.BinA052]
MSEILRIRSYAGYLTSKRVEPRVDPVPMHMHETGFSVCLPRPRPRPRLRLRPRQWQRALFAVAASLRM